jgi:hypothetical protein
MSGKYRRSSAAPFAVTLGFWMRSGVSLSLALVRVFLGVLGRVNNQQFTRVVFLEGRAE